MALLFFFFFVIIVHISCRKILVIAETHTRGIVAENFFGPLQNLRGPDRFSWRLGLFFCPFQRFPYPLFVTGFNQLIKFIFAAFYRHVYVCCTGKDRVSVPWSTNFRIMALLGLIGGLHTALSNFSLQMNTVSLYVITVYALYILIQGVETALKLQISI